MSVPREDPPEHRGVLRPVLLLLLLLVGSLLLAVVWGRVEIPAGETLRLIASRIGLMDAHNLDERHALIILEIRLPRALLAAVTGGCLALSGCLLQGLFRNPLAEPGILGISAGGAVGAVLAISFGWAVHSIHAIPLAAFSGALLACLAVHLVAALAGGFRTEILLLSGIAVGSLAGAATGLLITLTRDYALRDIVYWMMGGLEGATWERVQTTASLALLGAGLAALFIRDLDALLGGEESALALGVPVPTTRLALLTLSALLAGTAVAVSGVIGFVGLVVPHLARLLLGPNHRRLIPASLLGGASFLVLADLLARVASPRTELRLGIVTALIGAPFFLYLLLRHRRETLGW